MSKILTSKSQDISADAVHPVYPVGDEDDAPTLGPGVDVASSTKCTCRFHRISRSSERFQLFKERSCYKKTVILLVGPHSFFLLF